LNTHIVRIEFVTLIRLSCAAVKDTQVVTVVARLQILVCNSCCVITGLFLDVESRVAGEWGRFPADAERDRSTCGRQSSADGQHMHLTTLHPSLLVQTDTATETAACRQDQEFWLRINEDTVYRQPSVT